MMSLLEIAAIVSCGGGLGGLLYWTSLYLASATTPEDEAKSFPSTAVFCVAQVFTGMGGAWAVLLATLWGKRASTGSSVEDQLQLFAISLVAGYAGNRLLPLVADQLTKEIVKEAERRTAKSARMAQRSELTAEVFAYLDVRGSQSTHQTETYQKKLRFELKNHPDNRKAAILLARLSDELQNAPDKAIKILQSFIQAKTTDGKKPDEDVADAYWNIANYYEAGFRESGSTKRNLRDSAIEAIVRSIAIVPGYRKNLESDDDFAELRNDPAAKQKLSAVAD